MNKNYIRFLSISVATLMLGLAPNVYAQSNRAQIAPPAVVPNVTETAVTRALIRIDELETQMRTLTDRLERAEMELNNQKEANQRLARLVDEQNSRQSAANTATETTETNKSNIAPPTAATQDSAPINSANSNLPAAGNATTAPIVAPTPAPAVRAAAPTNATTTGNIAAPSIAPANILLSESRLNIQRGEFHDAELKLNSLVQNHPNAPEYLDGLWLLGETRFVQRAYAPAAEVYVEYLRKSPVGNRAPDAYIRLASSFRELGDNNQRCLALSEFRRKTPNPTSVQRARADAEIARATCP